MLNMVMIEPFTVDSFFILILMLGLNIIHVCRDDTDGFGRHRRCGAVRCTNNVVPCRRVIGETRHAQLSSSTL